MSVSHVSVRVCVCACCVYLQTQTLKTAIESAQMLLRIDDIVSGIRRKPQGGPQKGGVEQEDPDNVDAERQLPE